MQHKDGQNTFCSAAMLFHELTEELIKMGYEGFCNHGDANKGEASVQAFEIQNRGHE